MTAPGTSTERPCVPAPQTITDRENHAMTGAEMIAAERRRQIDVEGYSTEYDAAGPSGDLARAAACYADDVACRLQGLVVNHTHPFWPWRREFWKPTRDDPIRQMVKAGALLAAEIDRLRGTENPVTADVSSA